MQIECVFDAHPHPVPSADAPLVFLGFWFQYFQSLCVVLMSLCVVLMSLCMVSMSLCVVLMSLCVVLL